MGFVLTLFRHFFRVMFQLFFWRSLFRIFNDFWVPMRSKIGVFLTHVVHFLAIRCIWGNCALAAVSARFSRFQGLSNQTFSMCFSSNVFKCIFMTHIC